MTMVAATRGIAKICGFYEPQRHMVKVTSATGAAARMARFEAMSDAELMAIVESDEH